MRGTIPCTTSSPSRRGTFPRRRPSLLMKSPRRRASGRRSLAGRRDGPGRGLTAPEGSSHSRTPLTWFACFGGTHLPPTADLTPLNLKQESTRKRPASASRPPAARSMCSGRGAAHRDVVARAPVRLVDRRDRRARTRAGAARLSDVARSGWWWWRRRTEGAIATAAGEEKGAGAGQKRRPAGCHRLGRDPRHRRRDPRQLREPEFRIEPTKVETPPKPTPTPPPAVQAPVQSIPADPNRDDRAAGGKAPRAHPVRAAARRAASDRAPDRASARARAAVSVRDPAAARAAVRISRAPASIRPRSCAKFGRPTRTRRAARRLKATWSSKSSCAATARSATCACAARSARASSRRPSTPCASGSSRRPNAKGTPVDVVVDVSVGIQVEVSHGAATHRMPPFFCLVLAVIMTVIAVKLLRDNRARSTARVAALQAAVAATESPDRLRRGLAGKFEAMESPVTHSPVATSIVSADEWDPRSARNSAEPAARVVELVSPDPRTFEPSNFDLRTSPSSHDLFEEAAQRTPGRRWQWMAAVVPRDGGRRRRVLCDLIRRDRPRDRRRSLRSLRPRLQPQRQSNCCRCAMRSDAPASFAVTGLVQNPAASASMHDVYRRRLSVRRRR